MGQNRGKIISNDFLTADSCPIVIPRAAIRAFIYDCVYLENIIKNLQEKYIRFVMKRFNLKASDKNKIKHMIKVILYRDNDNLPPILYEPFDEEFLYTKINTRRTIEN